VRAIQINSEVLKKILRLARYLVPWLLAALSLHGAATAPAKTPPSALNA
jgi:hypothetical protein